MFILSQELSFKTQTSFALSVATTSYLIAIFLPPVSPCPHILSGRHDQSILHIATRGIFFLDTSFHHSNLSRLPPAQSPYGPYGKSQSP